MQADAVAKIAELARVQEFVVDDKHFTTTLVHEVKPAPAPLAPKLEVYSLDGFAALVTAKLEDLKPEDWLIQIEDFDSVVLVARKSDEHGRRSKLIEATPVELEAFPFGQFIDTEKFVIGLGSKFCPTDDLIYVINVASGLTAGVTRTDEDNGLAQKVTLKKGFELAKDTLIKNRVDLAPYRTFPEVSQPVSSFLFRLQDAGAEAKPRLALFEADGGKWKLAAISIVKSYLDNKNLGIPVIA